jgi:hypothetical protein
MAINTVADLSKTAANNVDFLGSDATGSGNANDIDAVRQNLGAIIARGYDDMGGVVTVGGTGNAITVASNSTYQTLRPGLQIVIKAASANTTAVTLNLDSLGAKAVRLPGDIALAGGEMLANGYYEFIYDSAYNAAAGAWVLMNPATLIALADPGADRIRFWDDSAGAEAYLALTSNLVINGTTLRLYETHGIALSDETTAITTGTAKGSFSLPYAFTLVGVYVTLNTASSSGTPTFDFNEAGTTCLSTKVVIDANELTGGSSGYQGTAAGAAVISDASLAAFAQLTWDIDVAGTGAKGAKAYIIGYRP